jgi:hypothetical protein
VRLGGVGVAVTEPATVRAPTLFTVAVLPVVWSVKNTVVPVVAHAATGNNNSTAKVTTMIVN